MNFGEALAHLKTGGKVSREGWNGKGMWLELQLPDENSKMRRPYIFINPGQKWVVPWVASQNDMLSDDWFVVRAESR